MGRNRVWKAKDPGFRRLLEEVAAESDRFRAKGQAWRGEGLGEWPLPRVLWRLAEMGLPCTREGVFQDAFEADSLHGLASLWALRTRAEGEAREFVEYAADVVFGWVFSNGGGPETEFVLAADLAIEDECREEKRDEALLRRSAEAAMRVVKVATISWPENPGGWIARMEDRCRVSVSTWAADLVIALGASELFDEGVAIAEAWAPLALTERFRAELPLLLATAGRAKEARERIDELLRDYPRSLSALFMAGEARVALGEREEGYGILERAMALAESREERLWVREHLTSLAALMDEGGKETPPPVFDEDEPSDDILVPEPLVANERIGRNDPCPCGSGKKYKKCCAKGGA